LKVERESQFNTAGGSEFQVRGAAVLNDRQANDVGSKWKCYYFFISENEFDSGGTVALLLQDHRTMLL